MTLDEFLRLPEKKPALEYEDGVVTQKVSPKGKHSRLQWSLSEHVNHISESSKVALAFPELRATFSGRSVVPDVAVYRWDRIPRDENGDVADDFCEPPDIAIEIVSPRQGVTQLVRRCAWYVANGVQAALLIDPADRTVLVFQPGQEMVALHGPEQFDLGNIVSGLTVSADALFQSLKL
jgi:Uma2 family endonuclease